MAKEYNGTGAAGSGRQIVRVPKAAELVASDLRRRIVRGELEEGDALLSEKVLMEQFGVSRPTVREAFRVLESEALISIGRGSHGGARVHVPSGRVAARYAGLILEHSGTKLADVYEARTAIEPPCAGMLAESRSQDDLQRLRSAIEEAEQTEDTAARVQSQTEFHTLVIELSGNQTMRVLCEMLRHIVDKATQTRVSTSGNGLNPHQAAHLGGRSHRRLLDLIEAGDTPGAEALWRKHLEQTTAFLLEAQPAGTVVDLLD